MTWTYLSAFSNSSTSTWYFLESSSTSYTCPSRNSDSNSSEDIAAQRCTSKSSTLRHSSRRLIYQAYRRSRAFQHGTCGLPSGLAFLGGSALRLRVNAVHGNDRQNQHSRAEAVRLGPGWSSNSAA